jgi:hypothetical protein
VLLDRHQVEVFSDGAERMEITMALARPVDELDAELE